MRTTQNNGWGNKSRSFIDFQEEDGKLICISGIYCHNGIDMEFAMRRQDENRGRYTFRGHLTILAPDGSPLYAVPLKATTQGQHEGKNSEDTSHHSVLNDNVSSPAKKEPVKVELNCNHESPKMLKAYIQKRAERVYEAHVLNLHRAYNQGVPISNPETITPTQACRLYGSRFVNQRYAKSTPKKKAERISSLERFYGGLMNDPMCKYSARQIQAYINGKKIGKETVKLASEFWAYCIKNMYCDSPTGVTPFPEHAEFRKSAKTLQAEALRATSLSQITQDNLYKNLLVEASGMDCGVALLLSGFTAEQIYSLTWRQIRFDTERPDFVQVGIFLPERAGAQHNYTRPCIPQCAMVLLKCHSGLMETQKTTTAKRELGGH